MASTTTSTETKALALLGQGVNPEMVASAVGVTVSRISQLLSDPEFSAQVAELRFKNLSAHADRDRKYDSLEDALIAKLEDLLPFMMKPLEVLRAIQTINGAKRRSAPAPEPSIQQSTVIQLLMPTQITQIFSAQQKELTINSANQVVKAGDQSLVTVQSSRMNSLLASASLPKNTVHMLTGTQDVQTSSNPPAGPETLPG